jgi:hypothetical protein
VAYINNQNKNQENELGMNNPQQQPAQNQQNQQQPQQVAPAADSASAPAPTPVSATSPAPASPQQTPTTGVKPSSGTSGTFQQYQRANQGQAQNRLGQAVQTNLQKNVGQASGALQRGQSNFQQLMEKGTLANRENAVQDVTKATAQARNIYTGDLEADKLAQQEAIQTAQTNVQQLQANKEAETQRIAQERTANEAARQKQIQDNIAAAQAELDKQNKIAADSRQVTLNDFGGASISSNFMDQLKAQDALKKAKAETFASIYDPKEQALKQAEEMLAYSDFNIAQTQDQAAAAQKALDELNSRQFTSGIDAEVQQRFADIINARYSGPESLRATGAYDEALNRVNKAQDLATLSKTAGGREDLLARLYGRPGSEYTRGMSRLDAALLNTNQGAMEGIQAEAQKLGGMRDQLSRANVDTQIAARNRASEIANIRQQSRDAFTKEQEAERALTEGRLDEAIASGNEFAQYFKDQLTGKTGTTTLNPYEAALLGVSSGEGLYNLGGEAVKIADLDRARMISQDEFARQKALADLAQLDLAKELSTNLKYSDQSLAGTQSAIDALDVAGTRAALNEAEQRFREDAEAANLVGTGRGKASKGNWLQKKTRTASSTIKNNVAKMLEAAGYDMNSEIGQNVAKSILSSEEATSKFLTGAGKKSTVQSNGVMQGAAMGAGTGAALGSVVPGVGTALGAAGGALIGAGLNSGNTGEVALFGAAAPGLWTDLAADLDQYGIPVVGAVGKGVEDVRNTAGNVVTGIGNIFGGSAGSVIGNLGSSIGGISGSALQKEAQRRADEAARKNLLQNYQNYLSGQGFTNRIGVSATDPAAVQRLSALQQLLSRLDRTNVGTTRKGQAAPEPAQTRPTITTKPVR